MGGICGITDSTSDDTQLRTYLDNMVCRLRHYEFYERGIFVKPGLAVGICDLPYAGPFPLPRIFEEARTAFFMKGEVFESSHSRISTVNRELEKSKGTNRNDGFHHLCRTYLDSKKENTFFDLNGHYVIVIVDYASNCIKIINDRFGFSPLYYHTNGGLLLFSSELKAIPAYDRIPFHYDFDGVAQFFQLGHLIDNTTLLDGVNCLPPASCLTFKGGKLSIETYWNFPPKEPFQKKKDDDSLSEIEHLFKQSIRRRLTAGTKFGLSLSGGVDSRVILSCIDAKRYPIHSFTRGREGSLEVLVSEQVARASDISHKSYFFPEDYLAKYSAQMVSHNDCVAPIYDAHAIFPIIDFPSRELFVLNGFCGEIWRGFWKSARLRRYANRDSRQFAKVFFQKNYPLPDEQLQQLFLPEVWKHLKGVCEKYFIRICAKLNQDLSPIKKLAFLYLQQRARRYIIGGPLILAQKFGYRAVYTDNDLLDAVFMLPDTLMFGNRIPKYIIKRNSPKLLDIMYVKTQLPLSSSTVRVSLTKSARRWRRYLHLPQQTPVAVTDYDSWICKENTFIRKVFQTERIKQRNLYNVDFVNRVVDKHRDGNPLYSRLFYRLLTFEIWYQRYL
ncbi:MAG: asparagine synthase-related protein, partial [Desulfatiglandaceae bacterium]